MAVHLDSTVERTIKKLSRKKMRNAEQRWKRTKEVFDKNPEDPKLDKKKHNSRKSAWKIRLLPVKGASDDGYRVFLFPKDSGDYLAFDIANHDRLDKK